MSGPGYDPKIIERFADQLLRKADTVRVGFAVGGGIFGVVVGSIPMTPLKSIWGIPAGFGVATIIVGALLGVLIGFVIGEGRAFRYRVQAQSAIFQLEIERRVTSAVADAVSQAAVAVPTLASPPAPPMTVAPPAVEETPPVVAEAEPEVEPEPDPVPAPTPLVPVEAPPVSEPAPAAEPLLRPPGAPAPPLSPTPEPAELPPLSPAANG